jgi:ABC-2 type transport system permease protein
LRHGLGAESLAWSLMFFFLPLTCVYYPVTTLPEWIQPLAWALPPTAVFEGMRALVIDYVFRGDLMLWALGLNALWLAVGAFSFQRLLGASKRSGSLLQIGE